MSGATHSKEEIYRRLGVPELWIWEREQIRVRILENERYAVSSRSRALPGIDLAQLGSFLAIHPASAAMRAYRAALRAGKRKRRRSRRR